MKEWNVESKRGWMSPAASQILDEVPVVFLDIVKVIPPDDGGPVHLQLGHHTSEDTPTDGHLKKEQVFNMYHQNL